MIKKLLAKLVNLSEQRENFAKSRFRSSKDDEAKLAKERHEQIMASREKKYVSEVTAPSEEDVLGPSDSALKKESK